MAKQQEKVFCDERLRHIAFIMDGNGRWAKKRGQPREFGHKKGAEVFKNVIRHCGDIGIGYVTVYAFSTENWKRSEREVSAIMKLLSEYIDEAKKDPTGNHVRVKFIGDMSQLTPELSKKARELEEATDCFDRQVNIAINYGGRAEIVMAVNRALASGKTEICEEDISKNLYTSDCPMPDLIVRTGGEYRISNFLMWQSAYSEFYFTEVLWPDLTDSDVDDAVREFYRRDRRYGSA